MKFTFTVLILCVCVFGEFLSEIERLVAIEVFQEMETAQVILIEEDVNMLRDLSKARIRAAHIEWPNVIEFAEEMSQVRTTVLWKTDDFSELENVTLRRFPACFVIWLIFPTTPLNITTRYDCEMISVEQTDSMRFELTEIYSLLGMEFVQNFGNWTEQDGLFITKVSLYDRRRNFKGVSLTTGYRGPEKFPHVQDLLRPQRESFYNFGILVNATLEPVEENSVFEELPYVATSGNTHQVLITSTIKLNMHIKKTGDDTEGTYFVRPLNLSVWLVIIVVLVTSTIASFAILHFDDQYSPKISYVTETLFRSLDVFSNQDGSRHTFGKNRVLQLVLRCTAGVIIPAYCACIISFMAIRIPKLPFLSLEGFIEDGTFRISGERNTFSYTYFTTTVSPITELILEKFLDPPSDNLTDGLQRVCNNPKLVQVGYNYVLLKANSPCKLMKIPIPITHLFVGALFSDSFVLMRAMKEKQVLYYSSGESSRLKKLSRKATEDADDDDFKSVDFELVEFIIEIVPAGCILSAIILLAEILVFYINKHRKPPNPLEKKPLKTKDLSEFVPETKFQRNYNLFFR